MFQLVSSLKRHMEGSPGQSVQRCLDLPLLFPFMAQTCDITTVISTARCCVKEKPAAAGQRDLSRSKFQSRPPPFNSLSWTSNMMALNGGPQSADTRAFISSAFRHPWNPKTKPPLIWRRITMPSVLCISCSSWMKRNAQRFLNFNRFFHVTILSKLKQYRSPIWSSNWELRWRSRGRIRENINPSSDEDELDDCTIPCSTSQNLVSAAHT